MKYAAFVLTLILPASTAFAQQMVVPSRPLTPLQVSSIEAIGSLNDSVNAAGAAIAALQRDLEKKTAQVLEAQAIDHVLKNAKVTDKPSTFSELTQFGQNEQQ